jgi:hypothetical protein
MIILVAKAFQLMWGIKNETKKVKR